MDSEIKMKENTNDSVRDTDALDEFLKLTTMHRIPAVVSTPLPMNYSRGNINVRRKISIKVQMKRLNNKAISGKIEILNGANLSKNSLKMILKEHFKQYFVCHLSRLNLKIEGADNDVYEETKLPHSNSKCPLNEALLYDVSNNIENKMKLTDNINMVEKNKDLINKKNENELPDIGALSLTSANRSGSLNITCSKEAKDNEDVSIDDLSGYLDNILHFPKKMSLMAEMMYT